MAIATRRVRPLTRRYAAAVGLLMSGWHSAAAVARACHSGSGNAVVRDLRRGGWRVVGRWVNRTGEGPGRHHKLFHIAAEDEGQLDLLLYPGEL